MSVNVPPVSMPMKILLTVYKGWEVVKVAAFEE